MRSLLLAAAAAVASAVGPVPGFRPPSIPVLLQSPEYQVWQNNDAAYQGTNTRWEGTPADLVALAFVDGKGYVLMGDAANAQWAPSGSLPLPTATQNFVTVRSTQTTFGFTAGGAAINMTWTSPLLTDDWDLLSRPSHYCTFSVASADGSSHAVKTYLDVNARMVVRDGATLVQWQRMAVTGPTMSDSVTALQLGAVQQNPLQDTNDVPNWGYIYLLANTTAGSGATMVLEYSNTTRMQFLTSGTLPSSDNKNSPATLLPQGPPLPGTGPQVGIDRGGYDMPGSPFNLPSADYNLCWAACNTTAGCKTWAYGVPNCGGDPAQAQCWLKSEWNIPTSSQSCRVSGQQPGAPSFIGQPLAGAVVFDHGSVSTTPVSAFATVAIDEILSINWFGEACPPYWRRALPVNDTTVVPMDMLAASYNTYAATINACNVFDDAQAALLSAAGGDEYATIAQLVYRQVFGASALVWVPSKQDAWYFLKEISSCGCLNTADVVYPAFPQILYYSPELMKRMVISHLEYAMNYTNQPYPQPFAPHHLGYWPIADLPWQNQENMPLEETAWDLLIIAAIGQRQGGDLTWLEPYWPAIETWYNFCVNLLPFPQEQLSTDDFDGVLYNATNLAMKGTAAMAAYGYILETYKGDKAGAAAAYATAASYASTMVDYAWLDAGADSHFMIGYRGSQGDGGNATSWPMLYNALWLRLLGYDNLLPNQATYLNTMRDWYAANKLNQYGLPLNSRKMFTKDDWMTFLAATYYTTDAVPQPSSFSTTLFHGLYTWANATTSRVPLSDWTNTDSLTPAGFQARPVYGAMWAPVLVNQASNLGLGNAADPAVQHAREVFADTHARIAREKAAGADNQA